MQQCEKMYSLLQIIASLIRITETDVMCNIGPAIAEAVSRWLPIAAAQFVPGSDHVGFVVDKVALGQV
jgi:hypothetical protein